MTRSLTRRFDELTLEEIQEITERLRPFVSDQRRQRIEDSLAARTRDLVVVLEDIYSDHNASAVLRTAEALGVLETHIVEPSIPFRVSRKITSGAHKWLDLARYERIEDAYAALRRRGYSIWASKADPGSVPIHQVGTDRPVALVFGNEHKGLSPEAIDGADGLFWVPMHGFVESLNISVAAALAMYEVITRRRREGCLALLSNEDRDRVRAAWFALSVRAARQLLASGGLPLPSMSRRALKFIDDGEPVPPEDEEPLFEPTGSCQHSDPE